MRVYLVQSGSKKVGMWSFFFLPFLSKTCGYARSQGSVPNLRNNLFWSTSRLFFSHARSSSPSIGNLPGPRFTSPFYQFCHLWRFTRPTSLSLSPSQITKKSWFSLPPSPGDQALFVLFHFYHAQYLIKHKTLPHLVTCVLKSSKYEHYVVITLSTSWE